MTAKITNFMFSKCYSYLQEVDHLNWLHLETAKANQKHSKQYLVLVDRLLKQLLN